MSVSSTIWILLLFIMTAFGGCGDDGYRTLYLTLCPIEIDGQDPFTGVNRLEAALDDGTRRWEIGPLNSAGDFGPLRRCAGCRGREHGPDSQGPCGSMRSHPRVANEG